MKMMTLIGAVSLCLAQAAQGAEATARLTDREGRDVGAVMLRATPSGVPLARVDLTGLPAGSHAIHLHETGDCSAADFTSAGGHISAGRPHGVMMADGPHPGDLPNVEIGADGTARIELFMPGIDVERDLLAGDGAAFVVHSQPDDHESQPAGHAGDRIACGAFGAPQP
ncbi:superoxide dismutase family protein [Paracoccus sp. p4-l81]|uniref:superoxide dismutase family protein n=1 Tax=Paracoccus sp. p4-l81 TaxID=3342806 RepID=UPI0035BA2B0F